MVFLLDFFMPSLQIILDLMQKPDLLLVFGDLVSHGLVGVVTLSVDCHYFLERFLKLSFSSFQCLIFVLAALECNLKILVHLV